MRGDRKVRTVLYLSSTSGPGGAEIVVRDLARSLDPRRFRSIVCLFREGWLQGQCEQYQIQTYVLSMNGKVDVKWMKGLWRLVRDEEVSIIHAHEFTGNTYGTLVARMAGIPLVATVHGKNYYWEKLSRRTAYRIVSRMAAMVTVSQDLKDFIVRRVGVAAENIQVIYNGIDWKRPLGADQLRKRRVELGLGEDESVVGSVGNLYPVKGHGYLLKAVPKVLHAFPRTTFLIIGRGELEAPLKEEVRRRCLEQRVRFLGLRKDIPELLGLMDVFVLPSLSEGLSIALLEALAAGKPVVATNVGGNSELVVDGENGFLIPPKDPDALATRVISLLANRKVATQLGENGMHRVKQHFSLAGMVRHYQDLYDQCLLSPTMNHNHCHRQGVNKKNAISWQ